MPRDGQARDGPKIRLERNEDQDSLEEIQIEKIEIRCMEIERRISSKARMAIRRDRPGKGETMRRIVHWHHTLVVLAVGLLALAAPLVAYADGGPTGG
jgi:hypothetical protein